MKVIILAAGKGNRLKPLTLNVPKPLIEIRGKPIIDRIFESLPEEITEAVIVVEYLKEKITGYVGNEFHGRPVSYVDQLEKKGTFTALLSAKEYISPGERFLVINGDDIHDREELTEYLKHPRAFGIQKMHMPGYHDIKLDRNGNVLGFYPQTEEEKLGYAHVATGAYVLDSHIFEHPGVVLRDGEIGLPHTIIEQKDTYPVKGVVTQKWKPINSFEDIKNAENFYTVERLKLS